MKKGTITKVAMGVAAATIGAAAFGAVHFMFLGPQLGVGDFFGIPYNVVIPVALGSLGLLISYGTGMVKSPIAKDILNFGSAAIIGVGVSQYAGWVAPATTTTARARPVAARVPRAVPVRPAVARTAMATGTKMI